MDLNAIIYYTNRPNLSLDSLHYLIKFSVPNATTIFLRPPWCFKEIDFIVFFEVRAEIYGPVLVESSIFFD